jgi:hypothetical protein
MRKPKPPKPIKSPRRGRSDAEMLRLLRRIAERLDRVFTIEDIATEPEPTPVAAPTKPSVPMRDRVSLVPHHRGPREDEASMGSLSQGGTDPERFWSRPDPYARAWLAEIFQSEDYRTGLRSRILAGTAKPMELQLAVKLGLQPSLEAAEAEERARMASMPRHERTVLMRLLRRLAGLDTSPTRAITGGGGGLVFLSPVETTTSPVPLEPVPESDLTDDALLPPKATR